MEFRKINKSILIVLLACCSCHHFSKKEKINFYANSRRSDLCRIPLIAPYEIISADRGNTWVYQGKFHNKIDGEIDSVAVLPPIIVLYNSSSYFPKLGGMFQEWLIIDTKTQKDSVFNSKRDFDLYTLKNNIRIPHLYGVHDVFNRFDKDGQLPSEWQVSK